ncbi:uncharacterized protein LOC119554742 [Drosophila subpulchrella]|uniref:uncharacterized protein LOC119554742 n=1 Tax=Drosophila subpulchrella TaxID=1486046 RepID=UPI0018A13CAD|nr:uncharacterized protein LOC119554742 [Drosophila subpulchrella]
MLYFSQLRSLRWIFLLVVICLDVEPRPIFKNHFQTETNSKNVIIPEENIVIKETIPGYIVFSLPDGGHIRVIYHVDKYGFYTETVG